MDVTDRGGKDDWVEGGACFLLCVSVEDIIVLTVYWYQHKSKLKF